MQTLIDFINETLSAAPASGYYPIIVPLAEIAAFAVIFILGAFFKKVRLVDKSATNATALSSACLVFALALSDENVTTEEIKAGLALYAVAFLLSASLTVQRAAAIGRKRAAIAPPDYLGDNLPPSVIPQALAFATRRNAESLPTYKRDEKPSDGIRINYSEILSLIEKIERRSASRADDEILGELKLETENFTGRELNCYERRKFSRDLNQLVKLAAKYGV